MQLITATNKNDSGYTRGNPDYPGLEAVSGMNPGAAVACDRKASAIAPPVLGYILAGTTGVFWGSNGFYLGTAVKMRLNGCQTGMIPSSLRLD